ncbi:S8 family serine peptidase [Streptococcus pneumoniae]
MKQRFSLRKYKLGLASVLLGIAIFSAGRPVLADELVSATSQTTEEVVSSTTDTAPQPVVESQPEVASTSEVATPAPNLEVPAPAPEATNLVENLAETAQTAEPTATALPLSESSNALINLSPAWKEGYKGEGMVVAVIDSGLDVEHDVLHLSDPLTAKYKDKESFEAVKTAAGISYGNWYNDKVIFGYNYMESNSEIKESEEGSHGMHVAGIAVGNPTKPDSSGEYIYGVAPEAQLMFMRVFSDTIQGTDASLYVRAIEDAVKLGADSINLSLGGANGSLINVGSALDEAIDRAKKAGVSVVIAAGNDGAFGSGHAAPLAENPDYGLVGSPSTAAGAISVASYNNSTITTEIMNVVSSDSNQPLYNGKVPVIVSDSVIPFEAGESYDYVFAGLGKEEDFENIDVTGKLALIKRGEITFVEKISNAVAKGAVGAIIFNNQEGANISMSLDELTKVVPSAFIPLSFGEELVKGNYQVQFNKQNGMIPNPEAKQLSDFSSWGLTVDGELKPDVAAPGGAIYSSINNGKYESKNGTSMASPHVAGVAVLVKQYLNQKYPSKTPEEIESLVKNLIMSTAKPHFNEETLAYTSPRQQGAGLVDTHGAVSTDLYVTGTNNYASLSLGNVDSNFTLSLLLHNISDTDKTLTYVTEVNTDTVEDGHITLKPRLLEQLKGETVTVKANSSLAITVKVDASKFHDELIEQMPNGYYLEGFVRFLDADQKEVVSIPYVGFNGEWQNLAVLESSIYELLKDNKDGFYFARVDDHTAASDSDATALVTASSEYVVSLKKRENRGVVILGSQVDADGDSVIQVDETGNVLLAFSPNNDKNQDIIGLKGVFLRNYRNLVASVYKADDQAMEHPIWQSEAAEGDKNFFSGDPKKPKSSVIDESIWDGTDKDGNDVADGTYKYVVRYTPLVPGAKEQTITFDVILDRKYPIITTGIYDEGTRHFTPRAVIEEGGSGIKLEQVFYLHADDKGLTYTTQDSSNYDNKVLIERNADGSYTLPENVDLQEIYYAVEDHAGNGQVLPLSEIILTDNHSGRVQIGIRDEQNNALNTLYTYIIHDHKGQVVNPLLTPSGLVILPFGDYNVELVAYDRDNLKPVSAKVLPLQVSEDKSYTTLHFLMKSLTWAPVDIQFNQAAQSVEVTLLDAEGRTFVLPLEKYLANTYGKDVPTGNYQLQVTLPEGLELLEDIQELIVSPAVTNHQALTIIDKRNLLALIEQLKAISEEARYFNAQEATLTAFTESLQAAKEIASQKQTQETLDKVTAQLEAALKALDGKETDFSKLLEALKQYSPVVASATYFNADSDKKLIYDTTYRVAQLLVDKAGMTQKDVDAGLQQLLDAQAALNGQPTNLSRLKELVSQDQTLRTTAASYVFATEPQKALYEASIDAAKAILTDPAATQEQVNQAIATLEKAIKDLDGRPAYTANLESLVADQVEFQQTSAKYRFATETAQAEYATALTAAKAVLTNPLASQAEVDQALAILKQAMENLDGLEPNKASLETLVQAQATFQQTSAKYRFATETAQAEYATTLAAAKAVLTNPLASQAEIDQALATLKQAMENLDGLEPNKTSLDKLVQAQATFQETSAKYRFATETAQAEYATAIAAAKAVLTNPLASQAEVDQVLATLKQAMENLDGVEPNKTSLEELVQAQATFQGTSAKYRFATETAQAEYATTLAAAKAVLTNPLASQAEIDQALATLKQAMENLDGVEPNKTSLDKLVQVQATFQETSAKYHYATKTTQGSYATALVLAQTALSNPLASQAEIDAAKETLEKAMAELDGVEPQKQPTLIAQPAKKQETPTRKPVSLPAPSLLATTTTTSKKVETTTLPVATTKATLPKTGSTTLDTNLVAAGFILLGLGFMVQKRKEQQ